MKSWASATFSAGNSLRASKISSACLLVNIGQSPCVGALACSYDMVRAHCLCPSGKYLVRPGFHPGTTSSLLTAFCAIVGNSDQEGPQDPASSGWYSFSERLVKGKRRVAA